MVACGRYPFYVPELKTANPFQLTGAVDVSPVGRFDASFSGRGSLLYSTSPAVVAANGSFAPKSLLV